MKVVAEASAALKGAPISATIDNPFMAPFMVLAVASQNEATVPSLQKKKVATPDANVVSSSTIPISALIENVDMEDLIKVYQVA